MCLLSVGSGHCARHAYARSTEHSTLIFDRSYSDTNTTSLHDTIPIPHKPRPSEIGPRRADIANIPANNNTRDGFRMPSSVPSPLPPPRLFPDASVPRCMLVYTGCMTPPRRAGKSDHPRPDVVAPVQPPRITDRFPPGIPSDRAVVAFAKSVHLIWPCNRARLFIMHSRHQSSPVHPANHGRAGDLAPWRRREAGIPLFNALRVRPGVVCCRG